MQRREIIQGLIGGAGLATLGSSLVGCAQPSAGLSQMGNAMRVDSGRARVLVVGGGYGGATLAKYVRLLSGQTIDVVLVEPSREFVSCPMSNLVLSGMRTMADITNPYSGLASKHGVRIVHDMVSAIDAGKRVATLASGGTIGYDKIVLAPGIDFMWDGVAGLREAHAAGRILHAWKAGPETLTLRRQLEAMRDGGTYAIVIPEAPYRCPPGPYERASMVAAYFTRAKPKSKVLILDANPDVTSKAGLFKKAWSDLYGGMVEYRPQHKAVGVDAAGMAVKFEVQEDVKADVLNVLPPMRAGALAVQAGLANANARWCHVNFLNFESTAARNIHVIGDAIQIAPGMPKSGHMASSHAKATAAALVSELSGVELNPEPMLTNTCYSFVSDTEAIHVASVHKYEAAQKTFIAVAGSGGVSSARSVGEGKNALGWAQNIWADTLK